MQSLLEEYRKKQAGKQKKIPAVVLFTTGSMNPVHSGHTRMLQLAARHFAGRNQEVLGCLLSPSDAGWSMGKPFGYLSNECKLELCKLVETDQIGVDNWEISQDTLMDFPDVRDYLMQCVADYPMISVYYVCGADHAAKCGLYQVSWCVIVGTSNLERPVECKAICLDSSECHDGSSTAIREAIVQNNNPALVRHMLHEAVYHRLVESGPQLFQK